MATFAPSRLPAHVQSHHWGSDSWSCTLFLPGISPARAVKFIILGIRLSGSFPPAVPAWFSTSSLSTGPKFSHRASGRHLLSL